jgi:nitrogen fixation-related uncharacterized protein
MAFSLLDFSVIAIAIAAVAWVLWYFLWSGDTATPADERTPS